MRLFYDGNLNYDYRVYRQTFPHHRVTISLIDLWALSCALANNVHRTQLLMTEWHHIQDRNTSSNLVYFLLFSMGNPSDVF